MSPALKTRLGEYGNFHQTAGNRACHWVGIPLIVLSLFGLLARLPIASVGDVQWTAAEVVIVGALAYYARLDLGLAALMVPLVIALDAVGRWLPPGVDGALLAVGWVFQFVGHAVYEKRSPAFFGDLIHLLIGPLFLLAKAVGRA
jgi:uncharacterized membrane protein YGL010W